MIAARLGHLSGALLAGVPLPFVRTDRDHAAVTSPARPSITAVSNRQAVCVSFQRAVLEQKSPREEGVFADVF